MIKKSILILAIFCTTNFSFGQVTGSNDPKYIYFGIADTISSLILSESRVINISLPEGYSPDSSATYPVIYLLDGGVDEDFLHISGLVRFYTTPWINRFPSSIVVGIENVNRQRDFTFATPDLDFITKMGFDKKLTKNAGGSEKFILFIKNELQPFIEGHYKTNFNRTIIGESLGGLLATEILLKQPALFNSYIIVSPSLWWGNESLLHETYQISKISFGNLKIYIGASNKTEDVIMFNDAQNLSLLIKKYNPANVTVKFDYLPNETHATVLHQAVYNAFKVLYPKSKK
ncbi:MAG: alpha/beta hydrolase-fold protein [Ferruginibacter sp.]